MASSKVMETTSTTNHDLPPQSSLCSSLSSLLDDLQQQQEQQQSLDQNGDPLGSSMSMDDLLKNIYASASPQTQVLAESQAPFSGSSDARDGGGGIGNTKSVEEVWKEIVAGGNQGLAVAGGGPGEMTLEDFLTKAGAVSEEDVRMHNQVEATAGAVYNVDATVGYANGGIGMGETVRRGGKRRLVEEQPLDKATQQKQRRMIKNRESATRSRERKQAYTVELESLVTQLEEENAQLLREEAEQNKERFKQLMENLVPVVEKQKPPRVLRRVRSLQW